MLRFPYYVKHTTVRRMKHQQLRIALSLTIIVVLAGLLGLIGARYVFVGSSLSLIPWGLAAMAVGYLAFTWRGALLGGAVFGFVLVFGFMLFGYQGPAPVIHVLIPFSLLALAGALCGAIGATVGHAIRARTHAPPRRRT